MAGVSACEAEAASIAWCSGNLVLAGQALHDINTHLEKTEFLLPVEWASRACVWSLMPRLPTGLGV